MTLEEAKEIILSNNYKILEESFIDDIIECFKKIIGPKWERIYKRIIGNNILANYIFDNRDLMPAYEIVTNVIDLEQQINEDFTMGVGAPLGAECVWANLPQWVKFKNHIHIVHLHHHIDIHQYLSDCGLLV